MKKPLKKVFKDMGLTVYAEVLSYWVEYEIFEEHDDEYILRGTVKWDRCSHWVTNKECTLHACDKQQLLNIGIIMGECYDWTAEILPTWNA